MKEYVRFVPLVIAVIAFLSALFALDVYIIITAVLGLLAIMVAAFRDGRISQTLLLFFGWIVEDAVLHDVCLKPIYVLLMVAYTVTALLAVVFND